MNTKTLVSFIAVVSLFVLVFSTGAVKGDLNPDIDGVYVSLITVDGIDVNDNVSVVAGEMVTVKVYFTANQDDTDVTIEAEIEGEKVDSVVRSEPFDIEDGNSYRKVLTLEVPYELKDDKSGEATLRIEIDGREINAEDEFTINIQRPSYNVDIKSVTVSQTVDAGENFPVDIVLKNIGYNDLDDLYVRVAIPALDVEKTGYFGDLIALECNENDNDNNNSNDCDEDEMDSVSGRIFLEVPYDAEPGVYALEVEVSNDDTDSKVVREIEIVNDFTKNVIVGNFRETAAIGEDAEYNMILVNPTDKLKVYRIVAEDTGDLSVSISEDIVAVPAGSSKTVQVIANAASEGEYEFVVDVFAGEELIDTVTFSLNATGAQSVGATNPIVILTVVLAIIFIVLLVVLIVLVGKKPEKTEEFGESYY